MDVNYFLVFSILGIVGAVAVFVGAALGLIRHFVERRNIPSGEFASEWAPKKVYLIGRVRIPNGRKTVWDVVGIVLTEDEAIAACTTKKDFYTAQTIGSLRDDKVVIPANLIFPLRQQQEAE
ncbi:hypothetical protein [Desulfuromonas acetoxidans]|uniref:hypothetical protein n=1 Tax=Desulfuromonas acetoxidans TaxID=891 RepID=UPI00292FCDA3|nr:hypothetical protein [Desulfuromonas acetoxidans]